MMKQRKTAGAFHESYAPEKMKLPSDRSTGLVFAVVCVVVGLVWRSAPLVMFPAFALSAGFALVSLLKPGALRPLNIRWMQLAGLMARIVNPLVLGLLFVVVIMPAGLLMQLFRDPLIRKKPKNAQSYWSTPNPELVALSSMKQQF